MQDERGDLLNAAAQEITESPPQDELEQQLIEGLAQSELQGRIQNAAETYNLCETLDDGLIKEIGRECYQGFKDDEDTREEWLEKHTFWLSLYMQNDYAETSDPERSWGATESVPILTESCDQFQARTYKAFFPQDTFISAIPMRKVVGDREMLEKRAQRVANHMSYQLGYKDTSYKQDKDALFLGAAVHGSFFTKTYFSPKLKRFKVDNVRPTDLVINYNVGPIRIEDVRRKSHIIYSTVGETQRMANDGYLIDACKPCVLTGDNAYNVKVNETLGLNSGSVSIRADRQAVLIEQQLWLDLDDTNDFRPYIVTFDLSDGSVKRISIGYEADQMGNPLKDFEQVQYYTHYKFKENPDGFYGLGLGHSIGDLNSAVNIMLRQSMDAATLANQGNMSGFISERLGLEGDEIRMVLGKFTKVPDTVGDLTNSIMMMKFPGPNDALMRIMQELDVRAQRMAATTDATTGTGKVEQPTTYLAKVEQALETFSSVQMRLASSLGDELQKIYRINQRWLPLVDNFMVNGTPEIITRQDYADDHMIRPLFDPKFTTQAQKVARSQAVAQVVMNNPLTQTRPQVMDEVARRQLESLDVEDIEDLIPPAVQPANIDNQVEENMLFLMPPGQAPAFDVFPEQHHLQHLAEVDKFIAEAQQLIPPENFPAVVAHRQKHIAFIYGQQKGLIPTGQVGASPSLQQQGNAMGGEGALQDFSGASGGSSPQDIGAGAFGGGATAGDGEITPPV